LMLWGGRHRLRRGGHFASPWCPLIGML